MRRNLASPARSNYPNYSGGTGRTLTLGHRHPQDEGLERDLRTLQQRFTARRTVLRGLASSVVAGAMSGRSAAATGSACVAYPEESNGPFPADGSRSLFGGGTLNVLARPGIVRSDITRSFGAARGGAAGVPLQLTITVVSSSACAALPGHAVYLWHCDRDGQYSMYSRAIARENYLRGIQVTDERGQVAFTSIFPACYAGRYPHIHLEVYPSIASATDHAHALLTTQLALPRDTCQRVYATAAGYGESVHNLGGVTAATDNVFDDSSAAQLAAQTPAMHGDVPQGFRATATLGVGPG